MIIPDINKFAQRINTQDLQRTNLYYVGLPTATLVSTALGASLNQYLGKLPASRLDIPVDITRVSDRLVGGIENAPGPDQIKRLVTQGLGTSFSAEMLISSVGLPGQEAQLQVDELDALRDQKLTRFTSSTIPMTIMCTPGAPEFGALWEWGQQMQDARTGRLGFRNDYAKGKNMEIVLLDRDLKPRSKYTMFDCHPISFSPVNMSWKSNNEVLEYEITWKFRGFIFQTIV